MAVGTPDIKSIAFVSLGCPKNLVDSEKMLGTLTESGLEVISDHDEADAIIVNTCGFVEASKEESLEVIREAIQRKGKSKASRVVVAGCLVQRHRAKLLEWAPGIDAMIGVFDRDHVLEAVHGTKPQRGTLDQEADRPKYWIAGNALQAANERGIDTVGLTVNGADGKGVGYFEDDRARLRLTPRHWAYLRVSEGCNQKCAFCTIPSIRGKMRSKPIEDILGDARALIADGCFELNLIGQDTTSYGYDIGYDKGLVGMLESLDAVMEEAGGGWARLMYAYPTYFDDSMIDAIARLRNIVKYIDIPLQHASDAMLTAMRRNVTAEQQRTLIEKLRERIPGMAIRTTLITGFPGETEQDHNELMQFLQDMEFDALGVFRYSREAGTPAGTMDLDPALQVPEETKLKRERDLMLLQQEIAFSNAKYLAEERVQMDILIDGPASESPEVPQGVQSGSETHFYLGRAYHQAPQIDSLTYVTASRHLSPGELIRCTIVGANEYDLVAQPTEELQRGLPLPVVQQ